MEQKRLGDIATYINGYAFKPEDRGSTGLPIIRIQDLTGNAYDLGFYDGKYPEKIEINDGDVLISWSASLGVYIWNRGKGLLNQHIFKVVFDKCEVNKQYFVFAVKYKLKEMELKTHGATMKHIVKKDFDNTVIPFPTVEKQADIAYILSKIESIVEFRQQELQQLDDLMKARFVEMFGNEKDFLAKARNKVSDICKSRVGIVIQPTQYYTDEVNGVRAFRSLNVKPFYINDSDWVYFSEADNEQLCRTQVKAGDVAVVRTGANLGDCCVIPREYDGCNAIDILLLTCNDNILPIYLSAFINYPVGKQQIINVQRGGAIKHLNLKQLETSHIYVPELELQQQFVDFVNQVNKSKVAVQKALDETQLLFDSLMQEYFG